MLAISHRSDGTQCGQEEAEHWRGEAGRCAEEAGYWREMAERWRDQAGHWREMEERWRGEAEYRGGEAGYWCGEAERLGEENTVLRARVAEAEGRVGALGETVATLSRLLYGASS